METNKNIKDFNIAEALKYAPKGLSKAMEKRKANHWKYKDYTLYYAAQRYGKPCEMFELKDEEK